MKTIDNMKREAYYLCDYGFLNDVIRGYLVAAMQSTGFDRDSIAEVLICLTHEFDELSAKEAGKIYKDF